jgi:orotidine-5'-phosphate decarboxylase
MQKLLIPNSRSVIVACDVSTAAECINLVNAVRNVRGIGGFKIGIEVGLDGLCLVVESVRQILGPNTVLIYDHQKAGNDIPAMGSKFAHKLKSAGCDAAILFPFAGPETQRRWTDSCQEAGLRVIVGGIMTHEQFLVSEGGYISDDAPEQIFELACKQGVRDFVVPGTKIEWVKRLRALLVDTLGEGNYVLYAPGFITQGGDITECGKAAGSNFHAIVGSAIYEQLTEEKMREAAIRATSQLAT